MLMYNVRQRLIDHSGEGLRWRISYSGDAPVVIDYPGIVGLGLQFGLDQSEIIKLIFGGTFPDQLRSSEIEAGCAAGQWSYRDAVAALLAAAERKRVG